MAEQKPEAAVVLQKVGAKTPVEQALDSAPVIYVDGAIGFGAARGMVVINLYQDRLTIRPEQGENQEQAITRTICARLVMNRTVVREMRDWLSRSLETPEDAETATVATKKAE